MAEKKEDLTLFVRGMQRPSFEEIDEVWDDTIINNAYDKALKMASEQVAKRLAMETNSTKNGDSKPNTAKGKSKPKNRSPKPTTSKVTGWKLGMPCRAIYEDDGNEYEAYLVEMIGDEDCIIKFIGYDNSEKVKISSLTPTLGNEERLRQLQEAQGERADDGFESQPASDEVEVSESIASSEPIVTERRSNKKNKGGKKKKNRMPESDFGDLPSLPLPNLNMFKNMGIPDMPMPPPPLPALARTDAEEQAISDMLLSWYMTGYYTGLYHGMKRQRQSRQYN